MNKYVDHLQMEGYIASTSIPNVRRYIGVTLKGKRYDYRTPLFANLTREQVMDLTINRLFDKKFVDEYPWLAKYEQDMLAKVGPLSIQKPWKERVADLENYYEDPKIKSRKFTKRDLLDTCKFFKARRNIRPRSWENTWFSMKKSTNSGTPFVTARRDVGNWTVQYMIANIGQEGWPGKLGIFLNAAFAGWRGQEGGPKPKDVKQRIVLWFPLSVNILELSFYQPLIEYVQKMDIIPAYISVDRVDAEITKLFDSKPKDDLVICTDFTRFDQHFNESMQSAAKYVIEQMIVNSEYSDMWLTNVFPYKFNIPIITPNKVYKGPHGMGSGSGGTNFDECIAHKALQFHAANSAHQLLNPHSMAYGDDGILTFPGISPDFIEKTYKKFGQDVNQSKFHVSRETAIVMRRIYHIQYRREGTMRGVYSVLRAMNHMISQERFYDPRKWSKEMITLKWLSVIENCKWHPLFHKFIDLVLQGDKYKLGLLIPGFYDHINRYVDLAKRNFGQFFSYNQDVQDVSAGIHNWACVKYILSLANKYR